MTESGGDDDVTKELNTLADQAKTSKDPYFLALVAHSLINRSRQDEGIEILKKVAEMQKPDGHLDATETSITGSGGRDLLMRAARSPVRTLSHSASFATLLNHQRWKMRSLFSR